MDLNEISFKECLLLARRAERRCARLFRSLAERARPDDGRLARALRSLAAEEERHEEALAALDERIPVPLTWHLDEAAVDEVLAERFGSLFAREDEGPVDREAARERLQAVEEECLRFYREMADLAPDEVSRISIQTLADLEAGHRDALA